jgi:protoporphyrinogen oxidase
MAVSKSERKIVIIGAGPAGLTASYLLSKAGLSVTVLETDPKYVGGISKTVNYKGFLFDIGGHRFYSKSTQVEDLWTELLPDDMLVRPRSSRICYGGKFFSYPLKPLEAFLKLGPFQSVACLCSYLWAKIFPTPHPDNFEDWVTNEFGHRLYKIFFKTYTEKVWGMSCKDISADWAAQRIKGLSLGSVLKNAFHAKKPTSRGNQVKSLIENFRYPRRGPGMMWEAAARKTVELGGKILMGHRVTSLTYDKVVSEWNVAYRTADGKQGSVSGSDVISSAPMQQLAASLSPALSARGSAAATSLKYRDFLVVALILKDRHQFEDNWIYIHDPSVKVGRIQNFKSWSPEMVPDEKLNCFGLEYFCFEGDGLWASADLDLIELAKAELVKLGLADQEDIIDGHVVRQQKAYPVYDSEYAAHVQTIAEELEQCFPGLHLVGRNGMHKYNNQDHAMMTAMLTTRNIIAGKKKYDVWQVNQDAEYHEVKTGGLDDIENALAGGVRSVPIKVANH